jgi:UDP-2,3-diacylglucosamine pyrophosphatase LpxH
MDRVHQFERTHEKIYLPGVRDNILKEYTAAQDELDAAKFELDDHTDSLDIVIRTGDFMTCDDSGKHFNKLVHMANITNVSVDNNKIVFRLWFRLWKWQPLE